jgi:hypothetical protein
MSYVISAPVENNAGAVTGTVTLAGVPALATINVLIRYNASDGPLVSVSDGSTYSAVAIEVVTGSSFNVDLYQLQNASSGTHVITVTITGGGAFFYIAAWYITGAGLLTGTSSGIDTGFPGTGANIISAPAVTPAIAGALVLSAGATNDATNTVTAGTSPNALTSVGLTFAGNVAEYFVQAVAAAITPTAGQTVNDRVGIFTWAYAPLVTAFILALSPGIFSLAGANSYSGFILDGLPGVFTLSGQNVNLVAASPINLAGTAPTVIGGRVIISSKKLSEILVEQVDFISQLSPGETILTAVCTCTVYTGVDANPSAMISGGATIAGTIVSQLVTGGVLGTIYEFLTTVTTSLGQKIELAGYLAVIPDLI